MIDNINASRRVGDAEPCCMHFVTQPMRDCVSKDVFQELREEVGCKDASHNFL